MTKNRFAKSMTIAAGFIFLVAAPRLACAQGAPPSVERTPQAASPGAQPNKESFPQNDFAGMSYSDDQKTEIDKIHREAESNKQTVAKDDKLTADQKDAMLLGYTRMEYGRVYKVLSPDQQRQVRQRVLARRASDQAALKKQPPRN
jgi:hypothetical protein